MGDNREAGKDANQPQTVTARVGHLSAGARKQIDTITRIVRSTFGHGEGVMPEAGRIVRIGLTAPVTAAEEAEGYAFAIEVNLPECAEDTPWSFTRRLIAAEIGAEKPVTLAVAVAGRIAQTATTIILYDSATDTPLHARELPRGGTRRDLH